MKSSLAACMALLCPLLLLAQKNTLAGWHLKDSADGYRGISLEKAYTLLKGRKSKPVIVAILDSGIDTSHEDLKPVLWRNPQEIPGNMLDDDKNGFADDIYGWCFKDTASLRNKNYDSLLYVQDRFTGNSDIAGAISDHGTHVAGIVGAVRNNGFGADGITGNVRIMMVRVIRDNKTTDYALAAGIRYAVDNGAMIINLSLGDEQSRAKQIVDDAVKYAMNKGALIIHAAGNEQANLDVVANFPTPYYIDSSYAPGWITVGASALGINGHPKIPSSNWGKNNVDVFAPGTAVYSCVPGNRYDFADGTSEAAPVVTGIAALIWSYFPELNAMQVKEIIERSVTPDPGLLRFCRTGGIVNACNAILLAKQYAAKKKKVK